MMASYYSEKEAVAEYKRSIQENRNKLETYFKKNRPWKYLKVKNCLTSEELDTLQRDRSTSIPLLLDTILVKNDLHTFTSFSKAVYSMPHSLGGEIFPFASSVGGLPVTEPQTRETDLPESSDDKCIVLWLVASKEERRTVASVVEGIDRGAEKLICNYYCQEYTVAPEDGLSAVVSIFVAYPSESCVNPMMDPVDLLFHFSPRPHVTVMTGVCCANEGEANLGDIVVVTPQNDLLHFFAELQHVMELWTIKEKIKLPPADIQQPSGLYTELQLPDMESSHLDLSQFSMKNRETKPRIPPSQLTEETNCEGLSSDSMILESDHLTTHFGLTEPNVIFGRTSQFKGSKERTVCNPPAVHFYRAALMFQKRLQKKLFYMAILGVSSMEHQSSKEEYESFGNHLSIYVTWKLLHHHILKMFYE